MHRVLGDRRHSILVLRELGRLLAERSWWLEMMELTARTCDELIIISLICTLSLPRSIFSLKIVNNVFQH